MPDSFADGLNRLLRQFANAATTANTSTAHLASQTPQQQEQSPGAPPRAYLPVGNSASQQYGFNGPQSAQFQLIPAIPAVPQSTPLRVLLLVQTGTDYSLAQIPVQDTTSLGFFKKLRSEYLRLRGIWRQHFSVWRYSHCDFYKVTSTTLLEVIKSRLTR